MSASSSASAAAKRAAALLLADALQSGFAAQRAGHQRRTAPSRPGTPVDAELISVC
jgi:hypothetical protein